MYVSVVWLYTWRNDDVECRFDSFMSEFYVNDCWSFSFYYMLVFGFILCPGKGG